MKNIIITLLVLLLSLTSCKEKENMNKKYHWVAYVKPVAGYPIVTYRGVYKEKMERQVFLKMPKKVKLKVSLLT